MDASQKYIYLIAISIFFVLTPFFFGFPQSGGERFYLEDHGSIQYVSQTYYTFSLFSYAVGILGIISLVVGLVKLQRDFGFKTRIILVLMDAGFFRELFARIKHDTIAIIIFSLDVVFLFILIYFRW